jgi:chromosome segregation ATPase
VYAGVSYASGRDGLQFVQLEAAKAELASAAEASESEKATWRATVAALQEELTEAKALLILLQQTIEKLTADLIDARGELKVVACSCLEGFLEVLVGL